MRIRGTSRELDQIARQMRAAPTIAEEILWARLRRRPAGAKFRRQHAVGRFVFDFVCVRARLVIEVDGASHVGREASDAERDVITRAGGYEVLRFTNDEIVGDVERFVRIICERVRQRTASAPVAASAPNFGGKPRRAS